MNRNTHLAYLVALYIVGFVAIGHGQGLNAPVRTPRLNAPLPLASREIRKVEQLVDSRLREGQTDASKALTKALVDRLVSEPPQLAILWDDLFAAYRLLVEAQDAGSAKRLAELARVRLVAIGEPGRVSAAQLVQLEAIMREQQAITGLSQIERVAVLNISAPPLSRAMPIRQLRDYASLAKSSPTSELRIHLAEYIRRLYLSDEANLGTLDPGSIVLLTQILGGANDSGGTERLRSFVVDVYLAKIQINAATVFPFLGELTKFATGGDSQEQARRALGAIDRLISSEQLRVSGVSKDKASDALSAFRAGRKLDSQGVSKLIETFMQHWLGLTEQWEELQPATRVLLAELGASDGFAIDKLNSAASDLYTRQVLGSVDSAALASAFHHLGDQPSAMTWALKALGSDGNRAQVTNQSIPPAVHVLASSKAKLATNDMDRILAHVKGLDLRASIFEDGVFEDLAELAESAYGPNTLRTVENDDGSVNLALTRVASWIRRRNGSLHPYLSEMDKQLEIASGDARARWELARAYGASLVHTPIRRTDGNSYIQRAFAAAESDVLRLACIREATAAGLVAHSPTYPLQVIRSTENQFSGGVLEEITSLRARLMTLAANKATTTSTAPQN